MEKRILIISYEFPPNVGGIGNHAYNLARSLSNEGFVITVLADTINVDETELSAFSAQQHFSIHWIKRSSFLLQTYIARIVRSVRLAPKADLVICTGKFPLWLSIILRFFNRSKQLVAVVHGSELDIKSTIPKKVTNFALTRFNTIISVSGYTQKFLPATLPATIKKFIIHNGINCTEFTAVQKEQLPGTPVLVTVGSLTERKGQENVVKALPTVRKQHPAVQYHVIGKPVIRERLLELAQRLKVDKLIEMHGAVDRAALLSKLASADVKLMLSNHTRDGDFEGFGIAVLEANAFGIPVIGSKNSGIADAIIDGKTGRLVDPSNTHDIAAALEEILTNYATFSAAAKEWAIQHDWKIIVKEYVAAIKA